MENVRNKILNIIDQYSFKEYWSNVCTYNFLKMEGYDEKLITYREASGENDTVITGLCSINKIKCVLIAFDYSFMQGTMGVVAGEKIVRAFGLACKKKLPVISISASGGVRLQEGTIALLQMAKTTALVHKHNKLGLLYISIISNPTLGGVSASFASLADIIIGEKDAIFGFTGKKIIEDTTRENLPNHFQTVEYAQNHGMLDIIVDIGELRGLLSNLLYIHKKKGLIYGK